MNRPTTMFWDVTVGRVRPCCGERPPTCRCGWVMVIDSGLPTLHDDCRPVKRATPEREKDT